MVVILRIKIVPNMLVQSLPLRLAFWAQLLFLESPIRIPWKLEQKYATHFGEFIA